MSDDIQTILAEAQKALAQSNPAIAAKLLSDILKLDACHRDANYYLAVIHRQAGEPEQALTHLSEILRIDPRDATANQEKGFSEMAINQPSEALASFRRAVTLNDALLPSWKALAALGTQLDQPRIRSEAEEQVDRLSSLPKPLLQVRSLIQEKKLFLAERLCRQFL